MHLGKGSGRSKDLEHQAETQEELAAGPQMPRTLPGAEHLATGCEGDRFRAGAEIPHQWGRS